MSSSDTKAIIIISHPHQSNANSLNLRRVFTFKIYIIDKSGNTHTARRSDVTGKDPQTGSKTLEQASHKMKSTLSPVPTKEKESAKQVPSSITRQDSRTESGRKLDSAVPRVPVKEDLKFPILDVGATYVVMLVDNTSPNNFTVQVDQQETITNLESILGKLETLGEDYSGKLKNGYNHLSLRKI